MKNTCNDSIAPHRRASSTYHCTVVHIQWVNKTKSMIAVTHRKWMHFFLLPLFSVCYFFLSPCPICINILSSAWFTDAIYTRQSLRERISGICIHAHCTLDATPFMQVENSPTMVFCYSETNR